MTVDLTLDHPHPTPTRRYAIRRAVTDADLAAARAVVLAVAERDLGYGYTPAWHWDLGRLRETYVDNDRQAMLVAVALPDRDGDGAVGDGEPDHAGTVVATTAVRIGGPVSPPHARWLAARYADRATVAQLLRVATLPAHRRHGLARRLVAAGQEFVRQDGGYRTICLHTNAKVPGAEAFWRSLPVVEVHDARRDPEDSDPRFETIHFELPLDADLIGDAVPAAGDAWARDWVRRWDHQQEGYVGRRDETYDLMFDVLQRLDARPGRLFDLACGPGSLSLRALRRFPDAEVTGLDLDPVLLRLARGVLPATVDLVERDLRRCDWHAGFAAGGFDAVASSTALHYLHAEHIDGVARGLARVLRPGGVFANHDTLYTDPADPRLAALAVQMTEERWRTATTRGDREDFATWWAALEAEPGLGELFAVRRRRFAGPPPGGRATLPQWLSALRVAGFAEVTTLAQDLDRRLIVAIR